MFQYTIAVDGPKKDVRKRNNKFGNPTKTETEAIRARNKCCSYSRWGAKDNIETAKSAYKVFSSNGKRFSVKYAPYALHFMEYLGSALAWRYSFKRRSRLQM